MNLLTKFLKSQKGVIIYYILVFGTIFLLLMSGLMGFISLQMKQTSQKVAWSKSLNIAEAGINYYLWCINNNIESDCLLEGNERNYAPLGISIGKFSLSVVSTVSCGQNIQKEIISTGWTNQFPEIKRKINVLYARASVAEYSYILNNNVWIGDSHQIRGPYHSNGGIRIDGENKSIMTSAQTNWACSDSFGCSPCPSENGCYIASSTCYCPGVFTTTVNSNPSLFDFPVPSFDFNGITVDLAEIKRLTSVDGQGLYFGPSGQKGYHVIFNQNGTIDVWKVADVNMINNVCTIVGSDIICDNDSCSPECSSCQSGHCVVKDPVINIENSLGNYTIPNDCGAIFFEDNLWVGKENQTSTVKGKVTVVAADLINPGGKADVWLQGNIDYTTLDGSDGLAIIAQHNNLIGLYSPDYMTIKGIFIAQTGFFGRNYYSSSYSPYYKRNTLEIMGSVVSNGRVGTQWGNWSSGYLNRESYFDPNLIYNSPSFVPYIEPDFKIINWTETK